MLLGLTKALAVFKDLMNPACAQSVKVVHIVFIDDILIYSKSKEDYEVYLKLVLELLKKEKLDKVENVTAEILRGLDQLMERKEGRDMYLLWVPLIGDARTLMMDEAHASRYLVQSRADKTYYDLRDMYGGHKYLADTNLHVHLEEIKVDKTLHFVEEPVEIIDCEVKILKRSRIPIVKSIGTRTYDSKEEPIEEESLPIESNEKVKLEESGEGRMADFRSLVGYLVAGFGPCGDRSSIWLSSVERVNEEDIPKTAFRMRLEVHFLRHVVNNNGIHVDPSKIETMKNWKIAKPLTSLTQKNLKYEWAKEQEETFQTLKDNLCNAPMLSLLDGPEDFVVYCDTSNQGLGCVLMQRGKSSVKDKILAALGEMSKVENVTEKMLCGMDQLIERKEDGGMNFIWVPLIDDVRTLIMDEAHASRYLLHSGTDKTYYDLRDMYGGHV
ncbi:putative reverse transcriptase domain-containing protein [Tanacetum coccineum]